MSWQIYGSSKNPYFLLVADGLAFRIKSIPTIEEQINMRKALGWIFTDAIIRVHRIDGDYNEPSLEQIWRINHE